MDVDVLAKGVAEVRARRPHAELELRLGSYVDGRFCAGVPKDVFDQLEQDMQDAHELTAEDGWSEVVDYFYPTARGERVRTRVTFDTQRMEVGTEHVVKQTSGSAVLQGEQGEDEEGAAQGGAACRIAWATETPLAEPAPGTCVPTHVRIKQRRCFRDVRAGKAVWSYELSKTWSAGGRSAVEHLQRVAPPVYEVECELVDEGGAYLVARADADVAASFLLKARLLLGDAEARIVTHEERCGGGGSEASSRTRKRSRAV